MLIDSANFFFYTANNSDPAHICWESTFELLVSHSIRICMECSRRMSGRKKSMISILSARMDLFKFKANIHSEIGDKGVCTIRTL